MSHGLFYTTDKCLSYSGFFSTFLDLGTLQLLSMELSEISQISSKIS